MDALRLVGFAIDIALFAFFLTYLIKLEKTGCQCALNWRRNYLIAFLAASLAWNLLKLVAPVLRRNPLLNSVIVVLQILFVIFSIQYIKQLKDDKCECSKSLQREVMFYWAWLQVLVIALSVSFIAYAVFMK